MTDVIREAFFKHRPGGQDHDQDKHGVRGLGIPSKSPLPAPSKSDRGTQERLFNAPREELAAIFDFTGLADSTYYSDNPDEAAYAFEQQLSDDWVTWQGARDIRMAATDILEGKLDAGDVSVFDPHQDMDYNSAGAWTGQATFPERQAEYLMEHLMRPGWSGHQGEMYRAFTFSGDEKAAFMEAVNSGEDIDFPLHAFATERLIGEHEVLDGFGTDALFIVESGATNYAFNDAMTSPRYGESNDASLFRDIRSDVSDQIEVLTSEGEDVSYYTEVKADIDTLLKDPDVTSHYDREMRLSARGRVESYMDDTGFTTGLSGTKISEDSDPDAYYEWYEDPPSYAPREVITGGRFKVKSVAEDPRGTYDTVVTIEQVGVFDPFNRVLVPVGELADA